MNDNAIKDPLSPESGPEPLVGAVKTGKYSIEQLVHYRCAICDLWWSIADGPIAKQVFCPWCGLKQEVSSSGLSKDAAMSAADATVADIAIDAVRIGSTWQHFKGGFYTVLALVVLEEDCDVLVVYANEKTPYKKLARRLSVWNDVHPTANVKRFVELK